MTEPWQRLDARMLLVHPATTAVRFLPVLAGSLVFGAQSGSPVPTLLTLAGVVALGVGRWLSTTYRVTGENVELRAGLLHRTVLTVPRGRVRSVDVTAGPLHRLLGLAVLTLGTGQAEDAEAGRKFVLDAMSAAAVPALRAALLEHAAGAGPQAARAPEIARWSPAWVRYAPFSASGLAVVAALLGFLLQVRDLAGRVADIPLPEAGAASLAAVFVVAMLASSSAVAAAQYLLRYGGFQVADDGRVLAVRHGLLTTRARSLDRDRLRGATLRQPLLLRLVGGASVDAAMTGGDASPLLLPQAPAAHARRVLAAVLRDARPGAAPLRRHPRAALRRRLNRAVAPGLAAAAALGGAQLWGLAVPGWAWALAAAATAAGVALGYDRYRGLGHAVVDGWLVASRGSLLRRRDVLSAQGVVGWTVRQSYFQRRAGLATLVAATPAGEGGYTVVDLAQGDAWALAHAVTPRFGNTWLRGAGGRQV